MDAIASCYADRVSAVTWSRGALQTGLGCSGEGELGTHNSGRPHVDSIQPKVGGAETGVLGQHWVKRKHTYQVHSIQAENTRENTRATNTTRACIEQTPYISRRTLYEVQECGYLSTFLQSVIDRLSSEASHIQDIS